MHSLMMYVGIGAVGWCACSTSIEYSRPNGGIKGAQRMQFEELAERWVAECDADHYLARSYCDATRYPAWGQIVALGPSIAPLVVERIKQADAFEFESRSSYQTRSEDLPWAAVLWEITDYDVKADPEYRSLLMKYYRDNEMLEDAKLFDPDFTCVVPELANPYILRWWAQCGHKQ